MPTHKKNKSNLDTYGLYMINCTIVPCRCCTESDSDCTITLAFSTLNSDYSLSQVTVTRGINGICTSVVCMLRTSAQYTDLGSVTCNIDVLFIVQCHCMFFKRHILSLTVLLHYSR